MNPWANDKLLMAAAKVADAAETLGLAAIDLTFVDRRMEASINSLALAASNLMDHLLDQVTLTEMADGDDGTSDDVVEGEVLS